MRTRSLLYGLARLMGDVDAIRRGRITRRLVNRAIGRHVVSRLWRGPGARSDRRAELSALVKT